MREFNRTYTATQPRYGTSTGIRGGLRTRRLQAYLSRGLVLAQAFIDDLPQQIVFGPGEKLHLRNELGPDPMDATQRKGRAEAGSARRREIKRHIVRGKWLRRRQSRSSSVV